MAVLFLDPLVLAVLLAVVVYVWLVWRGSFRRWFGRGDRWTVVAWPVPLLLLAVPVVAGGLRTGLAWLGLDVGDGGAADAALYALAYAGPWVGLALWPPRWLLPRWARKRLSALPVSGPQTPSGAVAALHARPGHGSLASWVWRVDAVQGWVWKEEDQLRFRSVGGDTVPGPDASGEPLLDDEAISQLRFSSGGELRLEPPRGGWWTSRHLDVDLAAVDTWKVRATRPWRREGLLTFAVEGRRPVHLWLADVRTLAGQLPTRGASHPG